MQRFVQKFSNIRNLSTSQFVVLLKILQQTAADRFINRLSISQED